MNKKQKKIGDKGKLQLKVEILKVSKYKYRKVLGDRNFNCYTVPFLNLTKKSEKKSIEV